MRYQHCDLESYAFDFSGANPSLRRAYMLVRRYLNEFPLGIDGTGLLFTGSIGVGQTHLAVGLLRELILSRGATGLFYNYRDLLKQVQNSYNPNVAETELEVLGRFSTPRSWCSTRSAPPSPASGSGIPSPTSSTPATTTGV